MADQIQGLLPQSQVQGAQLQPPGIGNAVPEQSLTPPATPEEKETLKQGWREFLQSPETRAALLQFGVNFAQPVQPGDTTLAAFGRSVAAGGEAAGRVTEKREAEEQTEFKRGIEERKVGVAEEGLAVEREGITSRETIAGERVESEEAIAARGVTSAEKIRKSANEAAQAVANIRAGATAAAGGVTAGATLEGARIRAKATAEAAAARIKADIALLTKRGELQAEAADAALQQSILEVWAAQVDLDGNLLLTPDELATKSLQTFVRIKKGLVLSESSLAAGVTFTDEDIRKALESGLSGAEVVSVFVPLGVTPERIEAMAQSIVSGPETTPETDTTQPSGVQETLAALERGEAPQGVSRVGVVPEFEPTGILAPGARTALQKSRGSPELLEAIRIFAQRHPDRVNELQGKYPPALINKALGETRF
ncbi:hypothetical protein LCGC14_0389500 [marine sediment metagenome]|uniref:Uncharacterized protein n=1 Tax=marine sediment metagenome TaxID=412755 RepID=A0A0F9W8Y4_9ZZZZ